MPAVHHPLADLDTILADLARTLETTAQRYVLGIAGPPGAGKSTLAHGNLALSEVAKLKSPPWNASIRGAPGFWPVRHDVAKGTRSAANCSNPFP